MPTIGNMHRVWPTTGFHTRLQPPDPRLSLNICREVFSYIGPHLPEISKNGSRDVYREKLAWNAGL